jgi:sugar lactone lactonase YvrE
VIFDDRPCDLGEGALWHPVRAQLFWFDILGQRLLSRDKDGQHQWRFPDIVSAAAWVERDILLIAGERDLFLFDLNTEEVEPLCELEADKRGNRPNDGRADAQGGFWIGTMGKSAEAGAGAIYRFYRGELRKLFSGITIPNSICFSPDGRFAQFSDTLTGRVMRVGLDSVGWPNTEPSVFLDLTREGLLPDGAVIDAAGVTWLAQWGAGRVAAYAPDGAFLREVAFEAPHTSCPSFGGADGTTLFCTTALQHMDAAARAAHPHAGKTFAAAGISLGQREHRVQL